DLGILEIQIGLMRIEPMPEIGFRHGIPGPVGSLEILENDARFLIALDIVAPYVELPLGGARRRPPRSLEPGMLIGGMVEHELGDDADSPPVSLGQEGAEIVQGAVGGIHGAIIGYVVSVILEGGWIERKNPKRGNPQIGQ